MNPSFKGDEQGGNNENNEDDKDSESEGLENLSDLDNDTISNRESINTGESDINSTGESDTNSNGESEMDRDSGTVEEKDAGGLEEEFYEVLGVKGKDLGELLKYLTNDRGLPLLEYEIEYGERFVKFSKFNPEKDRQIIVTYYYAGRIGIVAPRGSITEDIVVGELPHANATTWFLVAYRRARLVRILKHLNGIISTGGVKRKIDNVDV
jgi:hypothetical protein